jgi:hypothetical protein
MFDPVRSSEGPDSRLDEGIEAVAVPAAVQPSFQKESIVWYVNGLAGSSLWGQFLTAYFFR